MNILIFSICILYMWILLQPMDSTHVPEDKSKILSPMVSCNTLVSCKTCTEEQFCHWCESDNKCHVIGSVFGCTVGMDCKDSLECMRQEPEYIGTGTVPTGKIVLFIFVSLSVLALFVSCFYALCYWNQKCREQRNRLITENDDDESSIDLTPFITPTTRLSSSTRHSSGGRDHNEPRTTTISINNAGNSTIIRNNNNNGGGRCNIWLVRFCRCCCIMTVLAIVVFIILGVYLFPQIPGYSICSNRIEWGSILKALSGGELAANVELHFSVYNPNRFTLNCESISAELQYHQNTIGSGSYGHVIFDSGTITDVIVITKFNPNVMIATAMYKEHLEGKLMIDAKLNFKTTVWLFQQPLLNLNTSYTVNNIAMDSFNTRQYCKCK